MSADEVKATESGAKPLLGNLGPLPGSRRPVKRVGRGPGSGHGKTSCRGQKGQKARRQVRRGFEGGQMPLQRRLPKRGFYSRSRVENQLVKLDRLGVFKAGEVVDVESLHRKGLVRKVDAPVKILGGGEITIALTVKVPAVSESARQKITAAGGTVETL